jgi:hypothetical protein
MGLAVMMAATGVLGLGEADTADDTGMVFVALYMILFGAILFSHELGQICPVSAVENVMKKNFGFLYGPNGKGLFMLL